jgi:dolichol-phosphate mannosyltransferase
MTTQGSPQTHPTVSLVLPTYNEADNLSRLVPRLAAALDGAGIAFEVIVVDDDSPDGTWAVADDLACHDPRVRPIRRQGPRGLATAVAAGWMAARGEILGVMDADLQYPPEHLLALLGALDEDRADVAVSSRYAPGAHVGHWAVRRAIISRGAILLAKLALPRALGRLADPNSGCFVLRRRVIEGVELRPIGFKILIEVLARGRWQHVAEVPCQYEGRQAGRSKLGSRQTLEFLSHLARLAWDTRVTARRAGAVHHPRTEPR